MGNVSHAFSVRDARTIIARFGAFRATRNPAQVVALLLNQPKVVVRNDSPVAITATIQVPAGNAFIGFAETIDALRGANFIVSKVEQTLVNTFVIAPCRALYAVAKVAPASLRVLEVRT